MNNTIEKWRAEIDAIDDELLTLLNRRARLAAEIGLVKKRERAPLCDPDREREVLARVCESSDGPLDEQAVKRSSKPLLMSRDEFNPSRTYRKLLHKSQGQNGTG